MMFYAHAGWEIITVSMFVLVPLSDTGLSMRRVLDAIYFLIPKKDFPQVPFEPHLKKCLNLMAELNLHCSRFSELSGEFLPGLLFVGFLIIVSKFNYYCNGYDIVLLLCRSFFV